jgi:hypothetical protein
MAPVDKLIVQRTWGLHERERRLAPENGSTTARAYGPAFTYDEVMATAPALGILGGLAISIATSVLVVACVLPPVCALFPCVIRTDAARRSGG